MKKFINFLSRLNWSGFLFVFVLCIAASMMRKDETILQSLAVGVIGGIIGGLFPLFAGMDEK